MIAKKTRDKDAAGTSVPDVSAPQSPAQPASPEKRRPVRTFREDDVSASVWARQHMVRGELLTFYSVSLERSYRDRDGSFRYTRNFDGECLGRLVAVIQRASEYIQGLVNSPGDSPKS